MSVAKVLRRAAEQKNLPDFLCDAIRQKLAYSFACSMRTVFEWFGELTNEERSAFLYLCSLIAEDEE